MNTQPLQSKRQKLVRNSIYSVASWILPIFPTLVVTPIIVGTLGNELYGLYVIILGFTGYFFTLNIGKAVTKYVAEYSATGEIEKISNSVSAALLFGFAVGILTTACIAFFAAYFVEDILQISGTLEGTAIVALYLGCLTILVNMLAFTFQSILQGLQRFDAFMLVANSTAFLATIGTLIAAIAGYGVIGMLSVSLLVSCISVIASVILVKRILPELHLRLKVNKEAWSEVSRYGASIMAYQLFGSLLLLFERSWITRQFGPEALTFYVIPMTLAIYLQTFVASLVLSIFPVINEHLTETDILVELYKQVTKLILIILAFAATFAVVAGQAFLQLWLNEEFAHRSYGLLLIQVGIFSIVSLTMIVWQIAEAYRIAPVTAAANFGWMAISIPLMILLSYKWEVLGVAYARLLGVGVYIPLIVYIERRFLGGVFWSFWASMAGRIMVAALLAGATEYLVITQSLLSWGSLILTACAGGATFLILLYLFRLIGDDEASMLRNAFSPNRGS